MKNREYPISSQLMAAGQTAVSGGRIPTADPPDGNTLILSPPWKARLAQAKNRLIEKTEAAPLRVVPKKPQAYTKKTRLIDTAESAAEMLDLLKQRPISFIGIDTEFRYTRPGVVMKTINGQPMTWNDPRSIVPLLLGVAAAEAVSDRELQVFSFVVDLRQSNVHSAVTELCRLPVTFAGHFMRAELLCLWQLGLSSPRAVWDTWVAEKTFCMGLYHARYDVKNSSTAMDETIAKEKSAEALLSRLSLQSTCLRRCVHHPFAGDKKRLQQSFLEHPTDEPFTPEQIAYAAADAIAAAELYPRQVQLAVFNGSLQHLVNVEMPWTVTNAEMSWNGVRVDPEKLCVLKIAIDRRVDKLRPELAQAGLKNANSHAQVKAHLNRLGLLKHFAKGGKFSFDDGHLKTVENLHPSIAQIRMFRKLTRMQSDKLFTGELFGVDGRLHPEHRQLGSESGRNSMQWPNIGGLGSALRPLVGPDKEHVIGEVDLSQIEVGIAAALYNDPILIDMFNGQDLYVTMAKQFFRDILDPKMLALSEAEFKKRCRKSRDEMKVFTLAIIYGITSVGLASQLNVAEPVARRERDRFMAMFPVLTQAIKEAVEYGAIRGFAYLWTGVRRHRARTGHASTWERNWLNNTPVQGSAGIVFKVAGNRLRQRYEHFGARLILPLHDAYIFECRRRDLKAVAKITAEVMRSTVQEYFPRLNPRAEINIDHPDCWNKDGNHRSMKLWMINPALVNK